MTPAGEILQTPRLRVRNWLDEDRSLFREINSDPKVMEFFPRRRTAAEADALMDEVAARIDATGLGVYALETKVDRQPIGFCGLLEVCMPGIFPDETVEIGWRLAHRFWGHGYVTEAAHAILDHAFMTLRLKTVVSFAIPDNRRSLAVMERLGLDRIPAMDFDHPRVPETHPHLKRHIVYSVTAERWLQRRGSPEAGRT